MRWRATLVVAISGLFSLSVHARQRPDDTVAFEVASVKLNTSHSGLQGFAFPADRFEATNVLLKDLIALAYGQPGQVLPDSQFAGGPSWIRADRFDIKAKVAASSSNATTQKQVMLRTLLEDRFKLVVHREAREQAIYALVLARKDGALGPQLHHADVDCEALLAEQPGRRERCLLFALPSGRLTVRGQTMSAVAGALTRLLDRSVIDQTGLTGGFDADADFNPEGLPGMAPSDTPKDAPSLAAALQQQLGLKLQAAKGPVDVLVIDSVEHPTED